MPKAIHIKPLDEGFWSITQVELPTAVDQKVEAIQKLVGGYFECHAGKVGRNKVVVYVNDEAALNERHGFVLNEGRPLVGPAVITRVKDDADLKLTKGFKNYIRIFTYSR